MVHIHCKKYPIKSSDIKDFDFRVKTVHTSFSAVVFIRWYECQLVYFCQQQRQELDRALCISSSRGEHVLLVHRVQADSVRLSQMFTHCQTQFEAPLTPEKN